MSSLTVPAAFYRATPARLRSPNPRSTNPRRAHQRAVHRQPVFETGQVRRPEVRRAGPVRLTRRGRLVLGALVLVLAFGVPALLRAPAAASNAPASSQVATRMTVQPGDTLWGIAQRAAPDADPRVTVARIMEMNSLHSSTVPAGSALFVPTSG